jgi:hypothetical protein
MTPASAINELVSRVRKLPALAAIELWKAIFRIQREARRVAAGSATRRRIAKGGRDKSARRRQADANRPR